ncbi:tyrosine-protein phosphatase [Brevibacterium aurantiacum]|uniref:Protein tyrosine phosphatase n=1 Tax=Brevibacterium aurantiacum TaxID=273384 RepID=A0A2A3ZFG0_BREAU|nr:tyrosine-protein phosphatase [Brevibacterium aurantiacum]AZL08866.1 protein-tyrosine-phosphatase [Brevibacterium aurantiacum]AZT92916.1 protein-tyrosine-phosphatase [Brevibacterium aurantiacum]PCC50276.1 protein tyrosine phosphatase [Brevibacterium aurantiacum]
MSLDRIDIEGTFNFRDIGGSPTSAGDTTVATGKVYRADGLAQLTDKSRADLRALGITTVVDLRDVGERSKLPDALDGLGVNHIELPIFDDHFFPAKQLSREEMKKAAEATGMDLSDRSLSKIYDLMIGHFGTRLAMAVDVVAQSCGVAVVFHCSAGKDRTGVVAAFIQILLGVGRHEILEDYAITSQHLSGGFLENIVRNFADAGISGNLAETATAAPPELMAKILDSIEGKYGENGVEAYLLEHGMAPESPEKLRRQLLASVNREESVQG